MTLTKNKMVREVGRRTRYNEKKTLGGYEMTATLQAALPIEDIRVYCRKWDIREFAVFGSVLREDFRAQSDVDVLVTFYDTVRYTLFDWVRMADELEAILGRPVDLVDIESVRASKNYLRRQDVLSTAQVVYAAS